MAGTLSTGAYDDENLHEVTVVSCGLGADFGA